jgi:hypothetical protein
MASQNDMKMAEETYAGFVGLVKWGDNFVRGSWRPSSS